MSMKSLRRMGWWAVCGLALMLAGCQTKTATEQQTKAAAEPSSASPSPVASGPIKLALPDIEERLASLYETVSPAVVHISTSKKFDHPAVGDRNLPDMFGMPLPGEPGEGQEPQYQMSSGSGFVWNKEGYIVSNNHVVGDAEKLRVTFHDGTTVPAKLVGTDPDSDLGVIKVDLPADRLTPITVADSSQVKPGHLAVAIGNPFELEATMTVGFVSAVGRVLPTDMDRSQPSYTIPDVIQTDAPINPGNSGGVLVNSSGQLIGVPFVIVAPSGASAGIGFAIPSALVQQVVPALISDGRYVHTWLGISGVTLSPDMAEGMKLDPSQRGALVGEVVNGSPAAAAKLRGSDRQITVDGEPMDVGGDVITGIDDEPVKQFDDIVAYLARATSVGQQITLKFLRDGKEQTAVVTLQARPEHGNQPAQTAQAENPPATIGILGAPLTPEVAEAMGLEPQTAGVLVVSVKQDGPAAQAGLVGSTKSAEVGGRLLRIGGDVILRADGKPVGDVAELQAVVGRRKPGDSITLKLVRGGKTMDVKVTLAPAQ